MTSLGMAYRSSSPAMRSSVLVTRRQTARHAGDPPARSESSADPDVEAREIDVDDVPVVVVNADVAAGALDAARRLAGRALIQVPHRPVGAVLPRQAGAREAVELHPRGVRPLAEIGPESDPSRVPGIELRVAPGHARHLPGVELDAGPGGAPAPRVALDVGMVLRLGAVEMPHRGRPLARAPRSAQRELVVRPEFGPRGARTPLRRRRRLRPHDRRPAGPASRRAEATSPRSLPRSFDRRRSSSRRSRAPRTRRRSRRPWRDTP